MCDINYFLMLVMSFILYKSLVISGYDMSLLMKLKLKSHAMYPYVSVKNLYSTSVLNEVN